MAAWTTGHASILLPDMTSTKRLQFYARIENVFDEEYQQVIGYGTPGLSGHVGAQWRL